MKVPEKELPTMLKNEVIEDENLTYFKYIQSVTYEWIISQEQDQESTIYN